jgi:diguanylate cyclase (GGDEF)-like protein/PAS domain S-box-containing protein
MASFEEIPADQVGGIVAKALQQCVDLLLVADNNLVLRYVSDGARLVLGWEPAELVGRSGLELLHPDDLGLFASIVAMLAGGYRPTASGMYRILCKDGTYATLEASGGEFRLEEEGLSGFWMLGRVPLRSQVFSQVLRRVLNEEPLSLALEHIVVLLPLLGESFYICEWDSGTPMFSVGKEIPPHLHGASAALGSHWEVAARTGKDFSAFVEELEPELAAEAAALGFSGVLIVPVKGADGTTAALMTLWTPPQMPMAEAATRTIGLRDLIEAAIRIRLQVEDLKRTARLDSLTGLANRLAFHDALRNADYSDQVVVLYIDLDDFKDVNDAHGHPTGDRLLQVVAQRIEGSVRTADLVARLGGDEFAVLCRRCGRHEAGELARRILETLRQPIIVEGLALTIKASIGIAWADRSDPEMLSKADQAMYSAKRAGRDTIRFTDEEEARTDVEAVVTVADAQ